jgi:hypothetical protein
LIKVGVTDDLVARDRHLNRECYAGGSDWRYVCHVFCEEAGRIEMNVQSALRPYQVRRPYEKAGEIVEAREIFACSFGRAWENLSLEVPPERWQHRKERRDAFINYNFHEHYTPHPERAAGLPRADKGRRSSANSVSRTPTTVLTAEHIETRYKRLF